MLIPKLIPATRSVCSHLCEILFSAGFYFYFFLFYPPIANETQRGLLSCFPEAKQPGRYLVRMSQFFFGDTGLLGGLPYRAHRALFRLPTLEQCLVKGGKKDPQLAKKTIGA